MSYLISTMLIIFLALNLNCSVSPNNLASKIINNGGVLHLNLYRISHNSSIKKGFMTVLKFFHVLLM